MSKKADKKALRVAADATDIAATTVGDILRLAFRILVTVLLVLVTTGLLFTCVFAYYVKTCLSTDLNITLTDYTLSLSSTIYSTKYDDSGNIQADQELAVLESTEDRIWVNYDDIPKNMEHAAVAIEDKRFYEHKGVDWYRTAGAFVNMFLSMKNDFGGSTITQQLIKNVTEQDDVTVQRKLLEIFQALELEKTYTKEEIMEWYLNVVYFGEGSYGIYMAADTYFGKDVSQLSLAECASIIGITNNPSRYDPFISEENNKKRQEDILYQMYDQGYITYDEYTQAVGVELVFVRGEDTVYEQKVYSYYVENVINDVLKDLEEKKGLSSSAAQQLLYHGGYQIYACVDQSIQDIVDSVYEDTSQLPAPYRASDQQLQSGIVIIDPYTGDIVALSGGVGEKTESFGWDHATRAQRPAGSSIKPLSVYGPAFDLGLITQSTLVDDSPDIVLNGTSWYPKNSGGGYSDVITIRTALINSINTVAAQIMDKLTPAVAYEYLTEKMGFTLTEADKDYAPMTLGQFTNGVTVREMAQAYTSFPNDGVMSYGRTYYLVTDSGGQIELDNRVTQTSTVFKSNTARQITDMLLGAVNYGTGWEAYLGDGKMPAAGKTGTTTDECDRWFCGYTPYYVAAVWTGYDMPAYMYFNGNPAAQIWKRIMSQICEGLPIIQFEQPTYWGGPTNIFGDLKEDEATPTPDEGETTPAPVLPSIPPLPTVPPTVPPTPEPTAAPTPEPMAAPTPTPTPAP